AAGGLFLLIAASAAVTEYGQVMTLVGVGNRILYGFRADLFSHVLRQSLAFHERKSEGELLTRIIYDTTRLRKGLNRVLTRLFQTVLTFVAILIVLFWVDAALAVVLAVAGTVALWIMAQGGYRVRKAARKNRKREGKLAGLVAEELISIREIHTFRGADAGGGVFERLNGKSLKQESKVQRLSSGMLMKVELLISLGIGVVLIVGAQRVAAGAVTAGELVLFVSYATALFPPFFRFARQTVRMGTTVASSDRLRKIMDRAPAIDDAPDAVVPERLRGTIELRDVSARNPKRRRGTRKWALRDVNLTVDAGERVALVGPNGAGKSTLLRLLLRLSDPDTGEILVDGRDLREYAVAPLRDRMSVVLQGTVLFGLSVRDNIALGRPDATEPEILEAARRARALDLIERLPDGLDTIVKRQGRLFSAGERQRLAIARALLRDGAIWLLDEPTTGLDEASTEMIEELLLEVTRGRTTFWVTHDPRIARRLERVIYLAGGKSKDVAQDPGGNGAGQVLEETTDPPPDTVPAFQGDRR
ncbi:MAG: ABC transporter ATP-binding protein, partial [Longimicrobiales bacterium]|nr:ABC transporter ATP-binding protein [Longimicrobiales bacterium]